MGIFKKIFRTENLYAGPEPAPKGQKVEFDIEDVYAGPEQMEQPKPTPVKPIKQPRAHLKGGPPIEAVYAAPDVLEEMRRLESQPDATKGQPQYPFNHASPDISQFQMVYAAPGQFPKPGANIPLQNTNGNNGNGLAMSGMLGSVSESDDNREIVTCSKCGGQSHEGKFCENCGFPLIKA